LPGRTGNPSHRNKDYRHSLLAALDTGKRDQGKIDDIVIRSKFDENL
jgi:hypothetical protein